MESLALMQAVEMLILPWFVLTGLLLVQLLVADVAGIRAAHIPGTPVPADHDSFLFRASRALANSNESVVIFVLLSFVAALTLEGSGREWAGYCLWSYLAGRGGHMLCYYFDIRLLRSVSFAIALLALLVLWVMILMAMM